MAARRWCTASSSAGGNGWVSCNGVSNTATIGGRPASPQFESYIAKYKATGHVKGVRQVLPDRVRSRSPQTLGLKHVQPVVHRARADGVFGQVRRGRSGDRLPGGVGEVAHVRRLGVGEVVTRDRVRQFPLVLRQLHVPPPIPRQRHRAGGSVA